MSRPRRGRTGRWSHVSAARLRDVLRSTVWVVPALCAIGSVGLGIGLITVDRWIGRERTILLYPGPPEGARGFLAAITQAMIGFTALVFSITIVVLQLTSAQFSPRVLRSFLGDRLIQVSLGVFVATFVYAMTVQREVEGAVGSDMFVPRIAVTVAFLLVLLSVGMFIAYLNHVSNMIRVAVIIGEIGDESRTLLAQRYLADLQPARPPKPPGAPRRTVPAPRQGVLVSVNEGFLLREAQAGDVLLVVVPRIGDFVPGGAPLVEVHGEGELDDEVIVRALALDTERTMEQDLAFGFRQLVDIAERALSPAVNDPTTACQCIDQMHDLLRRLAGRPLPTGCYLDEHGVPRLIVPQYGFADFLDVAVSELWRYGSDASQVPARLADMLSDLETAALPTHRAAIRRWSARLAATAPAS